MRIGIFTDTYLPDVNGVVTSVVTLKKALEKNGHTVFIVTNHDDMLKTTFEDNVLRLPGLKLDFLYGYKLTNPIQIAAAKPIKGWNLDIIHVHQEFGVGIFGRSVAKAFEIPLVTTYHTTYEDYTHYVNFFKSQKIDMLSKKAVEGLSKAFTNTSTIVISPSKKTKLMLEGYGVTNRIDVIPTGLDLERFLRNNVSSTKIDNIKKVYDINDNQIVFVFVGRLAKEKSVDIVIEAFNFIKDRGLNFKFLIVGDGPEHKDLLKQVEKDNLENYISFTGLVDSADVPAYYHVADAFISASTTETQGLTYIEALACGLGIFAKYDNVLDDIVIENKTGFFFEDAKQLALKIENFVQDKTLKNNMSANALKIASKYSLDEYYQKIIQTYKDAIEMEQNVKDTRD